MCGRITCRTSGEEFQREFNLAFAEKVSPRYNLAPTQPVPAVVNAAGPRILEHLKWGLIPKWAKDPKIGSRMINARAETLAEKPAFRHALEKRRCLVLADGFYEWKRDGKLRTPYHVQRAGGRPFAMAGLWEEWTSPTGELVRSCTIVTTSPSELLAKLHDRMPLILAADEIDLWLSPAALAKEHLDGLLRTSRVTDLELYPVSPKVNSVSFDGPELLERPKESAAPATAPAADLFAGSSLPGVAPRR